MGCGHSKNEAPKTREKFGESEKLTFLVFGMPDSGQTPFIKTMEKSFSNTGGFNQNSVNFIAVSTDRSDRKNWVDEYTNQTNVIGSFFFVDVSSPSSALLSVKTLNWMMSQIDDKEPPLVVGYVKTQNHSINFKTLTDYLPPELQTDQFIETNQQDVQRLIDYVAKCISKHTQANDGENQN